MFFQINCLFNYISWDIQRSHIWDDLLKEDVKMEIWRDQASRTPLCRVCNYRTSWISLAKAGCLQLLKNDSQEFLELKCLPAKFSRWDSSPARTQSSQILPPVFTPLYFPQTSYSAPLCNFGIPIFLLTDFQIFKVRLTPSPRLFSTFFVVWINA